MALLPKLSWLEIAGILGIVFALALVGWALRTDILDNEAEAVCAGWCEPFASRIDDRRECECMDEDLRWALQPPRGEP